MNMKCFLGMHNWTYTPAVLFVRDRVSLDLGIYKENKRRVCTCCGRKEYQDVHCLGLNPPEYIKTWMEGGE